MWKPRREKWIAYGVHVFTASGIIPAALAMHEIIQTDCDPRRVFGWLLLTTLIDAVDGPLARRYHVQTTAPSIDGRTMDDLLDYLTFAFIPLMLAWRMDWMPTGLGFTVSLAMGASLFGFAHREAKNERHGFFRGFPSYWNIAVFYAGIVHVSWGPWPVAVLLWLLAGLTVAPIHLIYPNQAPRRHRRWLLLGSAVWTLALLAMLPSYPHPPIWLAVISLGYPVAYVATSIQLWRRRPQDFPPESAAESSQPSRSVPS
ncbi:CDP-alcohol phosphatidyltransferase family protein [Rhodopirellula sp. P2]|uniref:CDP-alcohol phosphatidyltransferase family protein n=1 Tax=Rhodopirellula sp. P2 TaxID=2127060 RepID=UPI00236872CD|nr:CDP-alcohol phosphatidyltransferase family protein [Rhodopirellula sp. P2]WDQ14981.1 phosphatidylcholine synthase [Rhodopirellula sp. P2]